MRALRKNTRLELIFLLLLTIMCAAKTENISIRGTLASAVYMDSGKNKGEKMQVKIKAEIIEKNGVYRYFDRDGNELFEGDFIQYESGRIEELYGTVNGELGTDATNPAWIKSGRAVPCEYGIYPLNCADVAEARKYITDQE